MRVFYGFKERVFSLDLLREVLFAYKQERILTAQKFA